MLGSHPGRAASGDLCARIVCIVRLVVRGARVVCFVCGIVGRARLVILVFDPGPDDGRVLVIFGCLICGVVRRLVGRFVRLQLGSVVCG